MNDFEQESAVEVERSEEEIPVSAKAKREKRKTIPALRPSQVVNKKRIVYEFEGRFLESFGRPENFAKWYITGRPYAGKSSFLFILSSYLCGFKPVDYNSFEEGNAQTVADKIVMFGLDKKENDFRLLPKVPLEDFIFRLSRKRSAGFGVIDSLQHGQIKKKAYDELVGLFCNPRRGKSLLFVSHYKKNEFTEYVKHDCDIKIEVIGYVAYVESRYSGATGKPFVIWEQKAKEYWGKKYKDVIAGKYWPGQRK